MCPPLTLSARSLHQCDLGVPTRNPFKLPPKPEKPPGKETITFYSSFAKGLGPAQLSNSASCRHGDSNRLPRNHVHRRTKNAFFIARITFFQRTFASHPRHWTAKERRPPLNTKTKTPRNPPVLPSNSDLKYIYIYICI